ncbi:MAG: type VI secretion system baseplate subunit TssF [Saprospiraceae bacterium]|nr:type VI secretion system baseplate subunit TssF [Saprospiraceae bacterium]
MSVYWRRDTSGFSNSFAYSNKDALPNWFNEENATMIPTARQLYESILYRAAEEWGIDYEDVERDIAQAFDPLVRFMAGATASELERVYQHINDAEMRIMDRIIRVLVPEHYHLPRPAYALATADPYKDAVMADEATALTYAKDDQTEPFEFTPVFPVRLLPLKIVLLSTESQLLDLNARPRRRKNQEEDEVEFKSLLIGFESAAPIKDWSNASLWFDLVGRSLESDERASLFKGLRQVRISLHGVPLRVESGLPHKEVILEDHLNGINQLESDMRSRYGRQFLTFIDAVVPEVNAVVPTDYLKNWFGKNGMDVGSWQKALDNLLPEKEKEIYFLELHFDQSIHIHELEQNLRIRFNVFPVVNRKRCGIGKGEHFYLQTNALKWIHLEPKEPFLSIRKVYQEKPPEYPPFLYKPFADFQEDKSPTYTLRYGGVGRWDDFNAWRRLAYVISLLQDNYAHQELVQKAADTLSLEDVHQLLGNKINTVTDKSKPTQDVYLFLQPGTQSGIRVRVEYWTSVGDLANRIPARTKLGCPTHIAAILETESIELLTPTSGGADPLETTARLDALKYTLLSRGRLVTREDVRIFCKSWLQDRVSTILIQDGVGVDNTGIHGMTRRLEIWLEPSGGAQEEDWESVCHQLQSQLEERSSGVIPIFVGIRSDTKSKSR